MILRTALLLASLIAAAPAHAQMQTMCKPATDLKLVSPGVLTGAINPTAAPLQYIDESGKLVGLDPEFGDLIAARLCLKMEFIKTEFATMIPGLRAGRFDMIDTFMYYTPERAAQVHMIPYAAATIAIIAPAAATSAASLEDFAGKRFGTQLGSTDDLNARAASKAMVDAGKPAINIQTFPNYSDLLQALSAGQLDGAFLGTEQAFYYLGKGAKFFRIAATGLYPHAEALAFNDPVLADRVAAALNAMAADGTYDKLFAAYHHCTLPPPYKVTTGPIALPVCPPFKP